jgi:hypothetical protein
VGRLGHCEGWCRVGSRRWNGGYLVDMLGGVYTSLHMRFSKPTIIHKTVGQSL